MNLARGGGLCAIAVFGAVGIGRRLRRRAIGRRLWAILLALLVALRLRVALPRLR